MTLLPLVLTVVAVGRRVRTVGRRRRAVGLLTAILIALLSRIAPGKFGRPFLLDLGFVHAFSKTAELLECSHDSVLFGAIAKDLQQIAREIAVLLGVEHVCADFPGRLELGHNAGVASVFADDEGHELAGSRFALELSAD